MDFVRSYFFSFCHHFWVGLLLLCCCTHPKVMTKWKKWSTGHSCIRKEVTFYKIHTLIVSPFYRLCFPTFSNDSDATLMRIKGCFAWPPGIFITASERTKPQKIISCKPSKTWLNPERLTLIFWNPLNNGSSYSFFFFGDSSCEIVHFVIKSPPSMHNGVRSFFDVEQFSHGLQCSKI